MGKVRSCSWKGRERRGFGEVKVKSLCGEGKGFKVKQWVELEWVS